MMKSMTGYGTATVQSASGQSYTVEVKSVNHRYCDVHVKLPGKLSFLEQDVRKIIKERFERGRFDLYLSLDEFGAETKQVTFDKLLAAQYLEKLRELGAYVGLDAQIDLLSLVRLPDVLQVEQTELDQEEAKRNVEQVVQTAFEHLEQMRIHEGQMLEQDITGYLAQIRALTKEIRRYGETSPLQYKAALEDRIKRLTENTLDIDPERLAQEITLFVDRIDISEEIARLNGHIDHFLHLIKGQDTIGRKLDFLVQEMNREINTIGSKSNNSEISKHVVDIKSILEKIREQVQNVE